MSVDRLQMPNLSIITTPLEKGDGDGYNDADTAPLSTPSPAADSIGGESSRLAAFEFTPSPQGVDTEFFKRTPSDSSESPGLTKVLKEQLVTVDDDEIVVSSTSVSLPELDEDAPASSLNNTDHGVIDTTPRSNADDEFNSGSPFGFTSPRNITPSESIQHKMLTQSVNAIASPIHAEDYMPQLYVGPERTVLFHTESLGIKISRHTDGYVRVLSVIPYRSTNDEKVREGEIYQGDVVREVSDVNLRMPIDSAVWKLTIGLIKMAPRPLKFVVAREIYEDGEDENIAEENGRSLQAADQQLTTSNNNASTKEKQIDPRFGPTRDVHFLESCLGVKLHHTPEGYVQILSVTPYQPLPGSPMARTGDIRAGDVVLEVGGVWNLRDCIDQDRWGALVHFIRETRRPLCMVLADGQSLENVLPKEEKENGGREESNNEESKPVDSEGGNVGVLSDVCDADLPSYNSSDQDKKDYDGPNDNISGDQACEVNLSEGLANNESAVAWEAEQDEEDVCHGEEESLKRDDNSVEDYEEDHGEETGVINTEPGVVSSGEYDLEDINASRQNEDVYVIKEVLSMSFD